ncbi:hypothetical protein GCM10028833_31140 [Glycomyces tarimensis]
MVSVSVRQKPLVAAERNSYEYPHPDNPGLSEVPGDGFYDWAGRRLFLPNGSPDPATPGAYRYQTRPDLCDVGAPDSDPASPRYEPSHLRHRPGDTFEIGGKPHDPEDPGTYGTRGWRPDKRTGRHRRGELSDPIPPWEESPDRDPVADGRPSPIPRRRRLCTEPDSEPEEPFRFSKLREDAGPRRRDGRRPTASVRGPRRSTSSARDLPLPRSAGPRIGHRPRRRSPPAAGVHSDPHGMGRDAREGDRRLRYADLDRYRARSRPLKARPGRALGHGHGHAPLSDCTRLALRGA